MPPVDAVAERRLRHQNITSPFVGSAADLVARFGAVQAQEYPFATWGLGLRLAGAPAFAGVHEAFQSGAMLRTHVMRPTWHFVTPRDIRWLQHLTAPRVHLTMASYMKKHGIDRALLTRAMRAMERSLAGGRHLTRSELRTALARARLTFSAMQMSFVTMHAELERLICSGPRQGTQFTYALLEERTDGAGVWTPADRDDALGELARRFLTTHAPATIRDLVW